MARIIKAFKEEVVPCELDPEEIDSFNPTDDSDLNVARTNKFILVIDLPQCFKKLEDTGVGRKCVYFRTQKLQMNVFGKIVPEMEMPALEIPGWGQVPKVSSLSRPAHRPITVQFTVDSKYENYYVLYKWLDLMNDVKEGRFDAHQQLGKERRGHVADYTATFSLYSLAEYNTPVARWNYYGCFPTSIGAINFNKRDVKELESEFIFEYSFVEMELI